MTSFKETIEDLNTKILQIQDNNCRLEKENEILAVENCKLLDINKKLEKELSEKSAELVVYNFYTTFFTYCLYFVFILVFRFLRTNQC